MKNPNPDPNSIEWPHGQEPIEKYLHKFISKIMGFLFSLTFSEKKKKKARYLPETLKSNSKSYFQQEDREITYPKQLTYRLYTYQKLSKSIHEESDLESDLHKESTIGLRLNKKNRIYPKKKRRIDKSGFIERYSRHDGGLVMQKWTPGSCSFGGCGCGSSAFPPPPPPAMLFFSLKHTLSL